MWDEVASRRWQTPERWELGSTSWREHAHARWRGSVHRVGVALVGSIVSLILSLVLLVRRRPGANFLVAQLVSPASNEGLALDFSSWDGGINRLPVKDLKVSLFEVLALQAPLSLVR